MGSIILDNFFVNIPSLVMEIKVSKLFHCIMGAQKCHIFQYNNFKKFNIKRKIVYSKKKVSIQKKKCIMKTKQKVCIQTKKVSIQKKISLL